jgi:hypothetical protein
MGQQNLSAKIIGYSLLGTGYWLKAADSNSLLPARCKKPETRSKKYKLVANRSLLVKMGHLAHHKDEYESRWKRPQDHLAEPG